MSLTPEEREIVIQKSDVDAIYHIYSSSLKMQTKIEKAGYTYYKLEEDGTKYYKLPTNAVSFRRQSTKQMSEENKEKARQRLRDYHTNKKKED